MSVLDSGDVLITQDNKKRIPEPLSKLLTGVRYGGDYTRMADWGKSTAPATTADYTSILTKNEAHNTGRMKVQITKEAGGTYSLNVGISIDGGTTYIPTYSETGIALTIGIPHLQMHWGAALSSAT